MDREAVDLYADPRNFRYVSDRLLALAPFGCRTDHRGVFRIVARALQRPSKLDDA